ncbi:hypothetical protein SSBR45G_65870 [Bradyrhizobium sp. SSBR45G]|uniref:hypothetical protein n=1 Tax=unclassified Bradyrhizobium TaxID=2631580 RepID=UPI0023429AE8|nr:MULTISPECIES: hypothetical protein [unclassified Bradyrhizobium]GLH81678.1 hypothetical protein SSBR45G_65870 [Bradyrhizobium sp. SSBR45G]GLH89100.1 hypothetical protein SSBR45R_65610 [Bradyrhizobium sp. SSBR45R]
MQGHLLLAILGIRSSYARNVEVALQDDGLPPDTLQWWLAPTGCWRIRTFAIDHDIHTHEVDGRIDDILAAASNGNRKRYGDIIAKEHLIHFTDCSDNTEVHARFSAIALAPRLEVAAGRFAFWKPDDARYSTQSRPRE